MALNASRGIAAPLPDGQQWPRTLVVPFVYNEAAKIQAELGRFPEDRPYTIMVMDDGSDDGATDSIEAEFGVKLLRHDRNYGVGRAFKTAFEYFLKSDFEVFVAFAGNNKDEPLEIPQLVAPIANGEADIVQGSRYLLGGGFGNMPGYRIFATKLHAFLFSLAARKRVTESTNGFRAIHRRVLEDSRIDWRQEWLDQYELEPYLLFKAIRCGYRHVEVPCTKIYPDKSLGQTKMKAIIGWWSILRPVLLLGLGLRR